MHDNHIPRHTAGCCICSVVAFTGGKIPNPTLTAFSPDIQLLEAGGYVSFTTKSSEATK